jgi:hypothetical protein
MAVNPFNNSSFTCSQCNSPIGDCHCEGRDEVLHDLAYLEGGCVAMKWCRLCDKHYARCRCVKPKFFIIMGGKEISPRGIKDMHGNEVIPDLTAR